MKAEGSACRVGFIGLTPVSLYVLERFRLTEQFQPTCIAELDTSLHKQVSGVDFVNRSADVIASNADLIVFANGFTEAEIAAAIDCGKQVLLDRTWTLTADGLMRLSRQARQSGQLASYLCRQRWSMEFLLALRARQIGRLGQIRSIQRISCEKAISCDSPFGGTIQEFAFHGLDQLLLLNDASPVRVCAERFSEMPTSIEDGFIATIRFSNQCLAALEIQTKSHLAFRSGWMLDGTLGAYRNGRLYTIADDGELIDEPLTNSEVAQDDFFREISLAQQAKPSQLPSLDEAARVVTLLGMIEGSARQNRSLPC